jgi:tetratricopeptide (TPR) repeat protein
MRRSLFTFVALVAVAPGLDAQVGRGGDPRSQLQLEAATLESRGDLDGAEDALRRLLALEPESVGTIFALERVLRAKGELTELRQVVAESLERSNSAEVMALNLQLLIEADSIPAMEAATERWLSATRTESAYRVAAEAYGRALGPARALDVLRRGRAALRQPDALALEIGDALAQSGDVNAAVDEWAVAVGDGIGTDTVVARIEGLGARAPDAARRLVGELADSDVPTRRDAALTVALAFRLESESLDLARRAADDLEGRSRVAYLETVAARARGAQLAGVAAWAYEELGGDEANPEQRREVERRIVGAALEAGDTAMALAAQRRVAASYARSSTEGRRAQAEAIRLQATAEPDGVVESWLEFREIFPDAPELDEVAAAVAASLQARGEVESAASVLEGIEGPRSTLERAYLLFAQGDIESGRQALLAAVSGLPPVEATAIIQLASIVGRLSDTGKQALVSAGVEAHRGRGAAASAELAEQAGALPAQDRAPVLAEAARIAERSGSPDGAAAIREQLLEDHPDAPEVAEASLALARHVAVSEGDTEGAIRILEDLITRRPDAAVVPEARLELERLRSDDFIRGSRDS